MKNSSLGMFSAYQKLCVFYLFFQLYQGGLHFSQLVLRPKTVYKSIEMSLFCVKIFEKLIFLTFGTSYSSH